jgi:hypothetical protein
MKNIPQAYRPSYLWFWPPLILGGSVISAGTIHDLRRVKVPGTGPLWNPWPTILMTSISVHPCVKLGPEQSWHPFKINKWPITNYVQTQFSVISSNISMIIMYYHQLGRDAVVRFECENSAIDVIIKFLWKIFYKPIGHHTCGFDHR